MRWLLNFSVRHPRIIVGAVAAFSLFLGLFIPRIHLRLDARSLIPEGHPDLAASDAAAVTFGLRDVAVIGITRKDSDIYNVTTLKRIARLSQSIAHTPGIVTSSVRSIANTPRLFIKDDRFDVSPVLPKGSLLDAGTPERIRADVEALGLNDGILVSRDGKAAGILSEIKPDADRFALLRDLTELARHESQEGDTIYVSGNAPAQAVLGRASALDLMRLVPLVMVVLGIALTVGFRRATPALISLAEIGASLICVVGLMGLTGQSVFVTTLVLPVVLIAVGVSDDVYVLKHYFAETRHSVDESVADRTVRVFVSMIWPISLTTISTGVGLLSMTATSLEPLRIFGVFGALAILFSTLFTFTLVPALVVLVKPSVPRSERLRETGRVAMTSFWAGLTIARPGRILALLTLITAGAVLAAMRLRIDDSWIRNLPPESEVSRGDHVLNQALAGTTTLDLLVDTGEPSGFLRSESIPSLVAFENRLSGLPFVGASYGIFDDALRLNASLHGMNYASYRSALSRGELTLEPAEIEQALMLLSVARRVPVGEWIDDNFRRARLTIFIRAADYERIASVLQTSSELRDTLSKAAGGITPFGDGWISYLTVRLLVKGQIYSIGLAICMDLLLLTLLLRSFRFSLMAIIPVVFSILIVLSMLALTGTPLGIANSMFAGIAIGIGLDFAIHLTAVYRRKLRHAALSLEAMKSALIDTGPAILTSAVSIALGFSVLTLSEIRPNRQLGLMICLSLVTCACATLVVIPSLALMRKKTAMNKVTLFLLPLIVLISLGGCQTKSPTNKSAISGAKTQGQLPEPEPATIEKITGTKAPSALELIDKYNSRDLGSPGWRRVSMELLTDGTLTRAFTVLNIWRSDKDRVETLFLLEEPEGLKGTNYLLQESRVGPREMQVNLFLPAGERRVLEVEPSNFDEGLLGSDFTYNDVRMRLPTQGYDYRVVGKSTLRTKPVWALDAEPASELTRRSCKWKRARYYLGQDFQLLLGVDYFGELDKVKNSPELLKQMRVESFEQRDTVWTASKMFMSSSDNRATILTLKDARFGAANIDPNLFAIDRLPPLADRIKEGWSPDDRE